jgi:hypothetical protein
VDFERVLCLLLDVDISVWLDASGKLLIDKGAPPELKDLVRAHK